MKTSNCKFCGEEFVGRSIGGHTKNCFLNPQRQQNIEKLAVARASISEESRKKINEGVKNAWVRGAYTKTIESRIGKPGHKHTVETKLRLSSSRKAWLAANPDKHPWKNNSKFDSKSCQNLKNALMLASIEFVSEFNPIEDRFFAIDVAFPSLKIGIEINGEQHYNRDRSLKQYYQERHDLIESSGWKIYEIHYSVCHNQSRLDSIISSLIKNHDLLNVDLTFITTKKVKHETRKFSSREEYASSQKLSQESLAQWRLAIESVDTTTLGFIGKIAKLMSRSHTQVRRVLSNYFPEIHTFRRKSKAVCTSKLEELH